MWKFFTPKTPAELAREQLLQTERELLTYQANKENAEAAVTCLTARAARLKTHLASLPDRSLVSERR